jgi:hypothetical protein
MTNKIKIEVTLEQLQLMECIILESWHKLDLLHENGDITNESHEKGWKELNKLLENIKSQKP